MVSLTLPLLVACSGLVARVPIPTRGASTAITPPFSTRAPAHPRLRSPADVQGGLRLLEWIPSQKALVTVARFGWNAIWALMLAELAPQSAEGAYVRPAPQTGGATPEWPARLSSSGRYHVYLGNACPWCHRVGITLALRGLRGAVGVTTLDDDPAKASRGGWSFSIDDPDPIDRLPDLKAVYDRCTPGGAYSGRCTAPLLIDLQEEIVISNESGDIVRMLNSLNVASDGSLVAGGDSGGAPVVDLYPPTLAATIDETCRWLYSDLNNGVYRAGFATKQSAYESAERDVHAALERADAILNERRFICADVVTEADVWLLPTVARFDGIYSGIFRCGRRRVSADYPHIDRWLKTMLTLTGGGIFDLDDARRSYYTNLFPLNPGGIVPAGPTAQDLGIDGGEEANLEREAFEWRER